MNMQRGQSLVEFAAGSAAMLLLLLGVITLSGYQEVQRHGSVAARQVTYESAWQAQDLAPQAVAQRMYQQNFDDFALLDALGRTRYVAEEDLRVSAHRAPTPGLAGEAATLLLSPLAVGEALTGRGMDLEPGGYISGALVTQVVAHDWTPEPFRGLDIAMRQQYAILSDAWNSGSAPHVHDRTASLVPTQSLTALSTAWQALALPLSIIEPTIGRLCLGMIEPDVVPEDRLGPRVRGVNAGRVCQ